MRVSEALCTQCPRNCAVARRDGARGYCGAPWDFQIARAALHPWEEPCISGSRGSGTVFFSGCNLRCVFCQNREVSHELLGRSVSPKELEDILLRLQEEGAHNVNLVTPTPYVLQLIPVLEHVKPRLSIPILYNTGGYESVDTLRLLEGLVDIYLPDFKYLDPTLAHTYSDAPDYPEVAEAALAEMLRQCPSPVFDGEGLLQTGVVLRHLVLPGQRRDSVKALRMLAERFGSNAFLLSLMNQYTPEFAMHTPYPNLHRRLPTFEYESVCREADSLGFRGYTQSRDAATSGYTPNFHEKTF
ncbi:MAG: radical SAM protein [Clostridia bacterium]|nr:radical SAM protein [Clostridia bacterium]